jgi:hypothetical protein
MRKSCFLLLLIVLAIEFMPLDAEAQRFTLRRRYGSVGVSMGAMNYFGDIVPEPAFTSYRFKSTRPSISLSYTYRYMPRVSFRGSYTWGRIIGDDKLSADFHEPENWGRYMRNLSFKNDINELSVVTIIDLFENRNTYIRRPDWVPYGFVGIAIFHHNPKAFYQNGSHPNISPEDDIPTGWYALRPLGTEGQYVYGGGYKSPYELFQISIPFGLGVRYRLDNQWDLSFEVGWRKTFTDYLDDASTDSFIDKADLLSEENGSPNRKASAIFSDRSAERPIDHDTMFKMKSNPDRAVPYKHLDGFGTPDRYKRGNTADKDWYIFTGLQINYIIAPGVRGPKFR